MKRVMAVAFCLLVIFSATNLVFAKGATTRITIAGAGLQSAVDITDPEVLKNFNVWSGPGTFANGVEGTDGFIVDWASGAVTDRPNGLRTFEVSFYVKYANRPFTEQIDQLAYIVSYAVDPVTGQGYVYLPGKSDESYRLNTKAIYRGHEGGWFRANAAWQTAFRSESSRPSATRSMMPPAFGSECHRHSAPAGAVPAGRVLAALRHA